MNRHISFLLVWLIMVLMNSIITNQLIASNIKSTVTALDNPAPGYLRLDWAAPGNFFLVDNYGFIQYRDSINLKPSIHFKPLSNGLWITDSCNKYYIFNNALQYIDSIPFPSSYQIDFHDVNILSNSHYLLLCRQDTIIDMSKIIDGGLNNTLVHSAVLVETDRTGTIYWIWKAIDHLKLTDVTPDVDLHSQPIDFTHANAITEDSVGNIFLSLRFLDDIIKIDKSTGNIIWHLGGSKCKNNEFTFINDSIYGFTGFSHQHCISVLPNGNLLLFDNGNLKYYKYSRAVEYKIDEKLKTATKVWEYRHFPDIYFDAMGSAIRYPNGNTLINWGGSIITEAKPDQSLSFEMNYKMEPVSIHNDSNVVPISAAKIYRAYRVLTKMNAVSKIINDTTDYSYNDAQYLTGVTISVKSIIGSVLSTIEKHNYAPPTGDFADSDFTSILPYRWVFSKNSFFSGISGTIKIKANTLNNLDQPQKTAIYKRDKEAFGLFRELKTTYNSETGEITADFIGTGEFTIGSKVLDNPALSKPPDNATDLPGSGQLQWNKLQAAEEYRLQVAKSNDFTDNFIDTVVGNQTQYLYKNLIPKTKYFWRVRGINPVDTSQWSSTYAFTVGNNLPAGINDNIIPDNFEIYPNPVSDNAVIHYSLNETANVSITLYNSLGNMEEKITEENQPAGEYNLDLNTTNLLPGIYFMTMNTGIKLFTEKFIVAK